MSFCCYKKAVIYYLSSLWFQFVLAMLIIPLILFIFARKYYSSRKKAKTIAFFHPYCNAGGGGERVLWQAIKAIQYAHPSYTIYVYTGDVDASEIQILNRVRDRFNIDIKGVCFVFLHKRKYLQAERYPYFTLLGQSLDVFIHSLHIYSEYAGSIVVGIEALSAHVPEIFFDTMGYAFTAPLFRWLACSRTAAYIHYPTISDDMLALVRKSFRPNVFFATLSINLISKSAIAELIVITLKSYKIQSSAETYNNARFIANSQILSSAKIVYYKMFAWLYGFCGRRFQFAMVNSSWTRNHIDSIWSLDKECITTVYPPCDTSEFKCLPLGEDNGTTVISIGQFRPEKDHSLQIKSFAKLITKVKDSHRYKLILIGSCRDAGDEGRVAELRRLAADLGVTTQVEFQLNVSFDKLKQLLTEATVGLHTMWNEHFGIGVVECMAGGTVVLAHNSAGPKQDIVIAYDGNSTGYLADDEDSYCKQLQTIFELSKEERKSIMQNARKSVERFSDENFQRKFLFCTRFLFNED